VVICTKSFHHLPSLHQALEKIHKILKLGGIFLADEFGREKMDETTAKFLYERMDNLEAAGKFPAANKWPTNEDIKHDYLKRWQVKFQGGTGEAHSHNAHAGRSHTHPHKGNDAEHVGHSHAHAEHAGHSHAHAEHNLTGHTHSVHAVHTHAHSNELQELPGEHAHAHAHAHESHGEHATHATPGVHHHHHHALPASDEMINEVKTVFPNLEVIPCGFLYHFMAQRFDGSTAGEDIVKEFRREEEDLIAKKQIVAIGLRFSCTKI